MATQSCALEPDCPEPLPLCQLHFLIYKMGIITVPVRRVVRVDLVQVKHLLRCLLRNKSPITINCHYFLNIVIKENKETFEKKTNKPGPFNLSLSPKALHLHLRCSYPISLGLGFGHGLLVSWPLCFPSPISFPTFSQIISPKYSLLKYFY